MVKNGIKKCFRLFGLKISRAGVVELNNPVNTRKKYFRDVLKIDPDPISHSFCYDGFDFIKSLHEKVAATFHFDKDELRIRLQHLNYVVNSLEELFILKEVFEEGIYNFHTTQDFVFIDVGMNVGITSLYFSSIPTCKEIISFEPFNKTLTKAKRNFALNESSNKISVNEFGLGYPARVIQVDYSEEYKGSVGINGVASYINTELNKEIAELEIKDVYTVLGDVVTSSLKKVIKIDCEGAEYEIIRRLDETKMIKDLDFYMVEWHLNGPEEIKTIFSNNGFNVLSTNEFSKDIGFIYAFKPE